MENLLIFLIILIFIIRNLGKLLGKTSQGKSETEQEEIEKYFQSIGLPPSTPHNLPIKITSKGEELPKEVSKQIPEIKKEEPRPYEVLLKTESPTTLLQPLSIETFRLGILLSIILGPPKSKYFSKR